MTAKMEWDLRGVIVPLITPFKDDLSLDFPGVAKLVDYYIEVTKCDGIVPCGTTGESATLSHKEHAEVIEAVVKQAKDRVPVIASAGSNSTKEAVELTRLAAELGAEPGLHVLAAIANLPAGREIPDLPLQAGELDLRHLRFGK